MSIKTNKVLKVPEHLSGQRIDIALSELISDVSRTKIKNCILKGRVLLNEEVVIKLSIKVSPGDFLDITFIEEQALEIVPQEIELKVVEENKEFIVIDKASNVVVHPGAGNKTNTLLNGLIFRFPELKKLPRGGIVHRLDKDTTGLMMIAKNEKSFLNLSNQISNRSVTRIYQALVVGKITKSGKINQPIGRHPTNRQKQAVIESGKDALTHYSLDKTFGNYSHLFLKLDTGRTHQIRVHLSHMGFPIIGDPLYGRKRRFAKSTESELREIIEHFPRQALHASSLAFQHPGTGKKIEFSSDLPEDMKTLLDKLKQLTH